jgi:hypothetical protein
MRAAATTTTAAIRSSQTTALSKEQRSNQSCHALPAEGAAWLTVGDVKKTEVLQLSG